MLRLSLDFGRLCPEDGQFNEPLMRECVKTLTLIRMRGQEPFVTLHHFTLPKYLVETDRDGSIKTGGWEHCDAIHHFRFYIQNVIGFLANPIRIRAALAELNLSPDVEDRIISDGLVRYFMPINEPTVLLFDSYLGGLFPPYKRGNLLMVRRLLNRLVKAHDIALDMIKQGLKAQKSEPQVGVGHNWQCFEGFLGKLARWFQEHFVTSFERQGRHSDFLGIHYYFRWKGPLTPGERRQLDYSDQPSFGDVYPSGIRNVIAQVNSLYPQKPIFISEFGFSDRSDLRRPYWILETVRHILEAKRTGMPIKGMLLWTLVSNFEWQLGMSQKFGLFAESELDVPLVPSTKGIRSWEAWRAATKAISSPTLDNWRDLQRCHRIAYVQYKEAGGRH
jgi:beta-glucosidase